MLSTLHNENFPEYLKLDFTPKNVCYEHAMIMVRWLKFQGTETPSLQEQLIYLTNFLKILDNRTKKKSETKKYFYDRALARFT